MKITCYVFTSFLFVLNLSGCLVQSEMIRHGACYNKSFNQLLESTDLKPLFNDMAHELCNETITPKPNDYSREHCDNPSALEADEMLRERCNAMIESQHAATVIDIPKNKTRPVSANYSVLITDFVDIQSFTPASQGLLMGELMRGSLSSVCSTKITQVEFAKFFNLNEKGLVVLSRKVSEIKKDEYDQQEAIVGTYSYLSNKIIIFIRKINVVTGKISKMVTREIDYSCSGSNINYTVK